MAHSGTAAQERILRGVQMDPNGGCWLWERATTSGGYGEVCIGGGRKERAHRASYAAFIGPVAKMWVLHKCDVRSCVNPAHLFLGTRRDNIDDMVRKGRQRAPKGACYPKAKLTDPLVREIVASGESSRAIARRIPISDCMVRRIRRGLAWTHVTGLQPKGDGQ